MRLIKNILLIAGALSLVVLVVCVASFAWIAHRGRTLDRESHAYTDAAVTAVAGHWSADELLRRAAPQFLRASAPQSVRDFVADAARRYGPLVTYEGARGQATVIGSLSRDAEITATYVSHARFENGEVEFDIALIKLDGRWMITGFHLDAGHAVPRLGRHAV